MGSSLSSRQDELNVESEASSPASLIARGLNSVREGRYAEGVVFFALAREGLSPNQVHLAAVLDTFAQGHLSYWQAQQALHQASKCFVEADAKQQAGMAALEKLLPALMEDTHGTGNIQDTLQTAVQPLKKSPDHQPARSPASAFDETKNDQSLSALAENSEALPSLYFTCFGRFEVSRSGQPVSLCSNRNGQAILRYLLAQVGQRASMDTLMGVLWPEDEPEVAHHKLQVAISALRRSLNNGYACDPGGGYILYKNRVYQLNPAILMQSDVDEFLALYEAGQRSSEGVATAQYEKACQLYTGPFLTEDLYADWSFFRREQLSQAYLTMCSILAEHYLEAGRYEDGVKWATAALKENRCDEAGHRQLMRAYVALGRRSDALRQYQRCQRVLNEELGVLPVPETVNLFHTILNSEIPHK